MSPRRTLELELVPGRFALCRLAPQAAVPAWAEGGLFSSVTRTGEELSIVCPLAHVPAGVRREGPYVLIRVAGSLVLTLTGILASLAVPLAEAGIPIFALSTFDTDYLLLEEGDLDRALLALREEGHRLRADPTER